MIRIHIPFVLLRVRQWKKSPGCHFEYDKVYGRGPFEESDRRSSVSCILY